MSIIYEYLNEVKLNKVKLNKDLCDIIESYLTRYVFNCEDYSCFGWKYNSINDILNILDSMGILYKYKNSLTIRLFNKSIRGIDYYIFKVYDFDL